MKKSKEYKIEDLLKETEESLKRMGVFDDVPGGGRGHGIPDYQSDIFGAFGDNEKTEQDRPFRISVSDDMMYVTADLYPPASGENPLSTADFINAIAAEGVAFGMRTDVIEEKVFQCNTEKKPLRGVLVAEGSPPVDEVAEHWGIEERLLGCSCVHDEDENIDYRKVSPFILVKEGEIVARLVPAVEGRDGRTVQGDELLHRVVKVNGLTPGTNLEVREDTVAAACDGRFEMKGDDFFINEVLQISGDVDYSTGHIDFPGDVLVGGHIQDGFSIKSGGSIYASKTLDASEIICRENLYVKQGVIGRQKASVRVGGSVTARFIENCLIEADDDIRLEVGTMNSGVYTAGKLELGQKGVIVGGTIYAQNGISATQIGTASGPRTEIYCGIDFKIANKLEWIKNTSLKLAMKLNRIKQELNQSPSNRRELTEMKNKLEESLRKLNEAAASLVYKLDRNENAEVEVRGKVYPGVYIEICHVSYVVNREMSNIKFKLDKGAGVIRLI